MPNYDGWDFLEACARLPVNFTRRCLLYMLSASINWAAVCKVQAQPLVQAYLVKPITAATLKQVYRDV